MQATSRRLVPGERWERRPGRSATRANCLHWSGNFHRVYWASEQCAMHSSSGRPTLGRARTCRPSKLLSRKCFSWGIASPISSKVSRAYSPTHESASKLVQERLVQARACNQLVIIYNPGYIGSLIEVPDGLRKKCTCESSDGVNFSINRDEGS